jgi:hypothetical protein
MNSISILKDWDLIRWVRLAAGSYFLWQGLSSSDNFSAFVGSFLLLQAITNTGCCGSGGCKIPESPKTNSIENKNDVDYSIVKP